MKKRILASLLSLVMLLTLFPFTVSSEGTPEAFGTSRTSVEAGKTYTIGTPQELTYFSEINLDYTGVTLLLTADITVSGNWTPVNRLKEFTGIFDGAEFTVTINCNETSLKAGFIGTNAGTVKDLVIDGSVKSSGIGGVGGIAGENTGTILNCTNNSEVSVGSYYKNGGITGINTGTIINCCNTGAVRDSNTSNGGIAGNNLGTIMNCFNTGVVAGKTDSRDGGIAGNNLGTIMNCFNTGVVAGNYDSRDGGIAGYNKGWIVNCRNTGTIGGADRTSGGIASYNTGSIMNCCNTGSTGGGSDNNGGIAGYSMGTICNCFNTVSVTGKNAGNIVGYAEDSSVQENCYWAQSAGASAIGQINGTVTTENIVSFGADGRLSSTVNGETMLLGALNNWVIANQTDATGYFGWKSGVVPVLSPEPVILTDSLPDGTIGMPYSVSLSAISGDPIFWSFESGMLPIGLMLSSDGKITGTPVAGGNFTFTARAENSAGSTDKTYTIIISKSSQSALALTGIPSSVTYGDSFTVETDGGSGSGKVTFGIVNQTDLSGSVATGVASVSDTGTVTILKPGRFQISAVKAGDGLYLDGSALTSEIITAGKKSVTISGIGAADKVYDGTSAAVITGVDTAVVIGNIDGENLTIDTTNAAASFADVAAGDNKTVTFTGFALSGPAASNYILSAQPADAAASINKAQPDYTLPSGLTAVYGQTLSDIAFTQPDNGVFTWEGGADTSVGDPGNNTFKLTFTPGDTTNHATVTGIEVTVLVRRAAIVPNPDTDIKIDGIITGGSYTTGEQITFTVTGGGIDNSEPLKGDVRYVPASWNVNPSGTWTAAPYTASFVLDNAGDYNLTVTFSKEIYNGVTWDASGENATKSVPFKVTAKVTPIPDDSTPETGDTPIIPLAMAMLLSAAIGFALLKDRKRIKR